MGSIREVPSRDSLSDDALSPTIFLPQDQELISRLQEKYLEYKERLKKQIKENRYLPPEDLPVWYAIAILEVLLKEGRVVTWDLSRSLDEKIGSFMRVDYFERYCSVIADYIATGGENVKNGTGFPAHSKDVDEQVVRSN